MGTSASDTSATPSGGDTAPASTQRSLSANHMPTSNGATSNMSSVPMRPWTKLSTSSA